MKEYWIVYPYEKTIHKFELKDSKFQLEGMYADNDTIKTEILDGFELKLEEVFEQL